MLRSIAQSRIIRTTVAKIQQGLGYVPTRVKQSSSGGGIIVSGPPSNTVITIDPAVLAMAGLALALEGEPGQDGERGAPGATGSAGSAGAQGSVGPPGYSGEDGADGWMGPPGPPGSAGTTGATGPVGPQGPIGFALDGQDGQDGLTVPGTPGATGVAGANGAVGPQGPIGFGLDGLDGEEGMWIPGPQGPTGATGATGSTGPQGPAGVGTIGLPGMDGDEGPEAMAIPGPVGPTGATGTSGVVFLGQYTTVLNDTTYTFSSISGAYTDLELTVMGRGTTAAASQSYTITVNGLTTGIYSVQRSYSFSGASSGADNVLAGTGLSQTASAAGASAVANHLGVAAFRFFNYSGTVFYKGGNFQGNQPVNTITDALFSIGGSFTIDTTAAITSITITIDANKWVAGSVFTLRGIQ